MATHYWIKHANNWREQLTYDGPIASPAHPPIATAAISRPLVIQVFGPYSDATVPGSFEACTNDKKLKG